MERIIHRRKPIFRSTKRQTNSYRVLALLGMILFSIWMLMRVERGDFQPLLVPTPTATRIPNSYVQQAEAYFNAGKIDDPNSEDDAIGAYRKAIQADPTNFQTYADLARILTYASVQLPTLAERQSRLQEAQGYIDQAVKLNDESGRAHAIRAFVLDWNASLLTDEEQKQRLLNDALNEAMRAILLDPNDGMGLAFYAEVQLDQGKWDEASQYAEKAVTLAPDVMDTHRVYATVLESGGDYRLAIEEYIKATKINPNLTFLYINIGVNYRILQQWDKALEYFDRAVTINEQIGVKDPTPYIAIAKVYSQKPEAEFFIAAKNAEHAVALDPANANTYGQLGIIYFRSRNYESALLALRCAVLGCSAEENGILTIIKNNRPDWDVQIVGVQGLKLESMDIAYYYAEYGQTLAYLSTARNNQCDLARQVLEQLRAYTKDSVLLSIVDGSEATCRKIEGLPEAP